MREIKFRIWNPVANEYIQDLSNFWVSPRDLRSCFMEWRPDIDGKLVYENPGFVYQQFTGLKDKIGREIYEGDIVKGSGNTSNTKDFIGTVEFGPKGVQTVKNGASYCIFWQTLEVVGNVFENTELLIG